jgi:hypothetical protein
VELLRDDRVGCEIELLTRAGATLDGLVLDGEDDPALAPILEKLTSIEAKRRAALKFYGDEQRPQPAVRRPRILSYFRADGGVRIETRTPTWGNIPSLETNAAPEEGGVEPGGAAQSKARRVRHRPPDPIARATVEALKAELVQRKALARGVKRGEGEHSQEKIANRLGLSRSRVQQAEALERVGWDLLRSHPEFSAVDDFVRWPNPEEAARLLASGREANR